MRALTQKIQYDPRFLDGKVPPETLWLPSSFNDYPFWVCEGFLDPQSARMLYDDAYTTRQIQPAEVKRANRPLPQIDRRHRRTDWLALSTRMEAIYQHRFLAVKPAIERFFNLILLESSQVQALGYSPGDYYSCHADNCSIIADESGAVVRWQPVASQRKITTVCFLNDDFTGGELRFDYLYEGGKPVVIRPRAGMLIAFGSNPYFAHSVLEVLSGYRITLAVWHDALRL